MEHALLGCIERNSGRLYFQKYQANRHKKGQRKMRELLNQWKRDNPNYATKYPEDALIFLHCLEEIQDFPLFESVSEIDLHFYADICCEHILYIYFNNGDFLDLRRLGCGPCRGIFEISTGYVVGDDRKSYPIDDYDIFKKILLYTTDLNDLKIPYEDVVVYIDEDNINITWINKKTEN